MQVLDGLSVATILGSGMSAGIFFTFSNFVMPALARLPKPQGVAAMQSINITVINPLALGTMLGTGALALAAAALGVVDAEGPARWLLIAAAAVYLIGCVGVTAAGNVPLNERLAKLDPEAGEAAELWGHYLARWTLWNTARTVACALTCVGTATALLVS